MVISKVYMKDGKPYRVVVNGTEVSMAEAVESYKKCVCVNAVLVKGAYFRGKPGRMPIIREDWDEVVRRRAEGKDGDGAVNREGCKKIHQDGKVSGKRGKDVASTADGCERVSRRVVKGGNSGTVRVCPVIRHVVSARVVEPRVFCEKFQEAHKSLAFAACVDVQDEESLKNCTCITLDRGNGFVAVKEDGDIISVMRSNQCAVRPFVMQALAHAIQAGGSKLDCYAINGAGLASIYAKNGFIPVCRLHWSEEAAGLNWSSEFGTPDVVMFMYIGDDVDDFVNKSKNREYPDYKDYEYVPYIDEFPEWREKMRKAGIETDYDFAMYVRDIALQSWLTKYRDRISPLKFVKMFLKDMR